MKYQAPDSALHQADRSSMSLDKLPKSRATLQDFFDLKFDVSRFL